MPSFDINRRAAQCGTPVYVCTLHIETEVGDIAILHHIVLALQTEQALVPGGGDGAAGLQILKGHDLGTDEAALDVGVDLAGGPGSLGAAGDGPGVDIVLAGGEEGNVAQQLMAGLDKAGKAALLQ